MTKLVTIYGGSGFVGRYISWHLARRGWRIRVAVRRPNEALFVRPYGVVGQVEPVFCNIRDDASVASVMTDADAVVNCVGVLAEDGRNTFDAVQAEGAGRIARLAAASGIGRMVHVSAIGADPDSDSGYARTKAAGEAAVLAALPDAVILRPSLVFGPEDAFFNRFANMARFGPALPLVGADTKFQPVYVDDVARAAVKGVEGEIPGGIYELGGPEVATFRELMQKMLKVIQRRRLIVNVPFWVAGLQGSAFDLASKASLGLWSNTLLTRDQVRLLHHDNVVAPGAKGFDAIGIAPVAMESVLESYLYRYRPHGQYDAIQQSAAGLKG